jgi:hypothetical protein
MRLGKSHFCRRLSLSFCLFATLIVACKKDRKIEIEDTPTAPRPNGPVSRGGGFDRDPEPELEPEETNVNIDVKQRTLKPLSTEERVVKAEAALNEIKNAMALGAEANKIVILTERWQSSMDSLKRIPKTKPEEDVKVFCAEFMAFRKAVLEDVSLSPSSKGRIGDAYVSIFTKNVGICAAE